MEEVFGEYYTYNGLQKVFYLQVFDVQSSNIRIDVYKYKNTCDLTSFCEKTPFLQIEAKKIFISEEKEEKINYPFLLSLNKKKVEDPLLQFVDDILLEFERQFLDPYYESDMLDYENYENYEKSKKVKNSKPLYSLKKIKNNTNILAKISDNLYISIGKEILVFQSKSKIVKYFSFVDINNAKYTYAVDTFGEKYYIEKAILIDNSVTNLNVLDKNEWRKLPQINLQEI